VTVERRVEGCAFKLNQDEVLTRIAAAVADALFRTKAILMRGLVRRLTRPVRAPAKDRGRTGSAVAGGSHGRRASKLAARFRRAHAHEIYAVLGAAEGGGLVGEQVVVVAALDLSDQRADHSGSPDGSAGLLYARCSGAVRRRKLFASLGRSLVCLARSRRGEAIGKGAT